MRSLICPLDLHSMLIGVEAAQSPSITINTQEKNLTLIPLDAMELEEKKKVTSNQSFDPNPCLKGTPQSNSMFSIFES
ncbi:hypothetical protein TorRG33x02_090600 [Trema orientale]|uniref:Uncharacterized protein n=1 Tax=Trema orientale TaxID=63057 RepID=A0A2P5FBL1_TREOI|nr:hypothetical protein TorRG33x02_090600 [Trema orientale]